MLYFDDFNQSIFSKERCQKSYHDAFIQYDISSKACRLRVFQGHSIDFTAEELYITILYKQFYDYKSMQ